MAFDLKAFEKAEFKERVAEVSVPDLACFFGDGEPAVWKVRNLTAPELAKAEMSAKTEERLKKVMEGMLSTSAKDQAEAAKIAIGISDELEPEFIKQLTKLVLASVEPKITRQIAVKLANVAPNTFYTLVAKINELSGKGADLGKLPASTKTKK
ncbi:MAG: hypothetical protein WBN66_02315 [Smithella sp.]